MNSAISGSKTILLLELCLLLPLATLVSAQEEPQDRPANVILILTDDQGWWDIGIHGNPHIETPTMDRLASESVRFTHFYASPLCAPTRAALLTGRHYQRTGSVDTYMGLETMRIDEVTLAEVLRDAGYRTALVGKWHLGRDLRYHPENRGFQESFGFTQALINRYFDPDQLYQGKVAVTTTGYVTDILTDQAIRFIRRNAQHPFFLYLAYNAPHSPYLAPDALIERYLDKGLPLRDARIYGMITSIDDNLSRLLDTVDEEGLRENTIVIFMSDNGGMSRYFRAGLRGDKGLVYEGGVRVPFMARWPGQFPKGAVVDAPAQHIDLFPTLCALLDVPLPTGVHIDGKSIASLLREGRGQSPHSYVFHQWNHLRPVLDLPAEPIRLPAPPELSFPHPVTMDAVPFWAVLDVASGHKLIRQTSRKDGDYEFRDELYNIFKDPGETSDLALQRPKILQELRQRFASWHAEVTKNVDYSPVPIEVGREEQNPAEIELLRGKPVGSGVRLRFNRYYRNTIEDWTDTDTSVRWDLDVVRPGRYEVILDYGCDPEDAGSKVVVRIGTTQLEHVVRATAGKKIFRPLTVGTLSLSEGATSLEISPASLAGQDVMTLYKIWLKWVGTN